jgi:hypothetical protein
MQYSRTQQPIALKTLKTTVSTLYYTIHMKKGLKSTISIAVLMVLLCAACKKDEDKNPLLAYELALDAFVIDLLANPLDSTGLSDRVRDYMAAQSPSFFGATVALLDRIGTV